MKKIEELNETIFEKEKKMIKLIHERDSLVKKMDDKISELTLETNFKAQGITNADGRDAFIKSKTIDERGELVEYRKDIGVRKAEIEFLKRAFELIKEKP